MFTDCFNNLDVRVLEVHMIWRKSGDYLPEQHLENADGVFSLGTRTKFLCVT